MSEYRPDDAAIAAWRRAAGDGRLTGLGRRLRHLGLTERAACECFAVRCPGHAPLAWRLRVGDRVAVDPPPAALVLHLFLAGAIVPAERAERQMGDDWGMLCDLGLVATAGDAARANVTILPVARALVVSDRADRGPDRDSAMFCDDSAFHSLGAMWTRAARPGSRWLDVGTGCGIAPLARPGAAAFILGSDINRRAIAMAELGAALSGISQVSFRVANLFEGLETEPPWDVVTFNAPIPTTAPGAGDPTYFAGAPDLIVRFWSQVPAVLAPGGEVVIHSPFPEADYPACLDLPGRVVAARYTPPDERPAFGITWWQPGAPAEVRLLEVTLTKDAPHVVRPALLDQGLERGDEIVQNRQRDSIPVCTMKPPER